MAPKGVNKAVSKRCPECRKQCPVATRHCHCGHQFFEERRRSCSALSPHADAGEVDDSSPSGGSMADSNSACSHAQHSGGSSNTPEAGKRRSERVKREKPNFYDALQYDNQMRKARKERQKEELQQHTSVSGRVKRERRVKNSSPDDDDDDEPAIKEKKRRKKKKKIKKEEEEEDEDIMAGLSPYREMSFAYVLADINLKLGRNNPKFT